MSNKTEEQEVHVISKEEIIANFTRAVNEVKDLTGVVFGVTDGKKISAGIEGSGLVTASVIPQITREQPQLVYLVSKSLMAHVEATLEKSPLAGLLDALKKAK